MLNLEIKRRVITGNVEQYAKAMRRHARRLCRSEALLEIGGVERILGAHASGGSRAAVFGMVIFGRSGRPLLCEYVLIVTAEQFEARVLHDAVDTLVAVARELGIKVRVGRYWSKSLVTH